MSWGQGGAGRVVGDRESNNSQLASNEGGGGGVRGGSGGGRQSEVPREKERKTKK